MKIGDVKVISGSIISTEFSFYTSFMEMFETLYEHYSILSKNFFFLNITKKLFFFDYVIINVVFIINMLFYN